MSESERGQLSVRLNNILLYGTFGLLMFGPLAFGAVEPWSIFVLECGAALLTFLWLGKQWVDEEITLQWNPLFLPMAGFGVVVLAQIVFRLSAYRHDTMTGAVLYAAYAMLCFVASQALIRSSHARRLAVIFGVYGFVIAFLALVQGIAPNGKLYWIRQPRLGGWIYGPYVNHNHYAGLMELLIPILVVMSLTHLANEKERVAAGIAAAVMTGTVFLSGSRGGMVALSAEFILLAIFLTGQRKGSRFAIAAGVFLVILISLLTWLGGKELTARLSSISRETRYEISGGTRLNIDRDAIVMFRRKPVLGWGLQTFPVVYPQFRTFYTNFFVNEAHNDYLQLLSETGLLGFGVMLWFVIEFYRHALPKVGNWMSSVTSAMTVASVLAATGILVHSFFDFNLQIPANAALFYVLCTLGAASPLLQRVRKRKPPQPNDTESLLPATEVV